MGLCPSRARIAPEETLSTNREYDNNKAVEHTLKYDQERERAVHKLLLLGSGESGKSTVFKQLTYLYGTGYSHQELLSYLPAIFENVISSMQTLIEQTDKMNLPLEDTKSLIAKKYIADIRPTDDVTEEIAEYIWTLWHDPNIKAVFRRRAEYQLIDSAPYFFDRVREIAVPTYVPSLQDMLRARVRTTGIVETDFQMDQNIFKLMDVGGQRNERKKWIHCFENVTAVLFVVAISAYDQKLFEDESVNRVTEALTLFDEICNTRWFKDAAMILFFNKSDLFQQKIQTVPLTVCFPEYQGPNTYADACAYMVQKFRAVNRQPKEIYVHITCATDTNHVNFVFSAVKDVVLRQSLTSAGLV